MTITEQFIDPLALILILGILVYVVVFIKARKAQPNAVRIDHDLAFACIIEPLTKASKTFRVKFLDLPEFTHPEQIHLVRFGLFNVGYKPVAAAQFRRPLTLTFTNDASILSAVFGESVKTATVTAVPKIMGNKLTLSPLSISGGGSLIFNLIVQGDPSRHIIDANIDDIETVRPIG